MFMNADDKVRVRPPLALQTSTTPNMIRHQWTPAQDQFLRDNWRKLSDQQIGNRIELPWWKVASRRQALGFHKGLKVDQREPDPDIFDVREFRCWITGGGRSMEPQTIERRQAA